MARKEKAFDKAKAFAKVARADLRYTVSIGPNVAELITIDVEGASDEDVTRYYLQLKEHCAQKTGFAHQLAMAMLVDSAEDDEMLMGDLLRTVTEGKKA